MSTLPKNLDEVKITNNSTGTIASIPLIDDVVTNCKTISTNLAKTLRNVYFARASKWVVDKMYHHLPFYLSRYIILDVYKSLDLTISNVPGPKEHLIYAGCKVLDLTPMFTTGFVHTFLGVISYGNSFKFIMAYDKTMKLDPCEFIKYVQTEMDALDMKLS